MVLYAAACAAVALAQAPKRAVAPQKIEVSVERKKGKSFERVDPGFVFEDGDYVRFRFKVNFNGYLYVTNHATSGRYVQLFPKQDTGLDNRVEKDREYLLPAGDLGWFRLEAPAGHELVYWIVSPARMADLGSGTSQAPRPERMTPRCDDSIFRARGECIDASAGPRAVSDAADLPPQIGGKLEMQPRELTLLKAGEKTTVVAQEGGEAPLVYLFRVAHK